MSVNKLDVRLEPALSVQMNARLHHLTRQRGQGIACDLTVRGVVLCASLGMPFHHREKLLDD